MFKIGQKVICVKEGSWKPNPIGPRKDDIVTIDGFRTLNSKFYLLLSEYSTRQEDGIFHVYRDIQFKALTDNKVIAELLEIKLVEERLDVEVKELEEA